VIVCYVCGATNADKNSACEGCGEPLTRLVVTKPPTRDDALRSGSLLNQGRYRVLHTVGRGGFAITYRAFDAKHGAYVAIKELFSDSLVSRDANQFD
jgi:serine/threonine protein kinase